MVESTLKNVRVKTGKRKHGKPERLIGDRGYDSNKVRAFLVKRVIEPIIPARKNNVESLFDTRDWRKYRRRWFISLVPSSRENGFWD
ncbi:MAG: hypothetical protein ACO394_10655, partial [Blastocatellia bacterium]